MVRRVLGVLALVTGLTSAAPVPKELKRPSDAERIQGAWLYDSWDMGNGGPKGGKGRWWFEKNKMYSGAEQMGDQKGAEYSFEIHPEKSPAELDYYSGGNLTCSGIYKFENEELHVAYSRNGVHPHDFKPRPGKAITILKRAPRGEKVMRRPLAFFLLFASVPSLAAAPVPKELKRPSDAERMRGVWMADGIAPLRWYFDGDTLSVGGTNITDNKGMGYALLSRSGELDFGGGNRLQYYGIYKFEGNDLRFAYTSGERPKDFTPRPGEFHHVLKRLP